MLQTEIFVQERFENPIPSVSVYKLYIRYFRPCSGRQSMASGDQLWLAGVHAGVVHGIASRRGAPSPVYYPLIFPALRFEGHAIAASRHTRPLPSSLDRGVDPADLQTLIYVRRCSSFIVIPGFQTAQTLI